MEHVNLPYTLEYKLIFSIGRGAISAKNWKFAWIVDKSKTQIWILNWNTFQSGLDLRGEWPGVGSRIDFRKSEVGHLSNCPKLAILGLFRTFLAKNVKTGPIFAQKWVSYQIFGVEKWVTFRFKSLPPLVGHSPKIEPWFQCTRLKIVSSNFENIRSFYFWENMQPLECNSHCKFSFPIDIEVHVYSNKDWKWIQNIAWLEYKSRYEFQGS